MPETTLIMQESRPLLAEFIIGKLLRPYGFHSPNICSVHDTKVYPQAPHNKPIPFFDFRFTIPAVNKKTLI